MSTPAAIEVSRLVKFYKNGSAPAVDNISFTVHQGEFFGLLGPNGAGKTTTISILCGLLRESSGSIAVTSLSHKTDHESIKKRIGVVPQEIALYPTLTLYENLLYVGNMYGMKGAGLKKIIDERLKEFGLSDVAQRQVEKLSGGMKRRVNLLAGILHQPQVLFLDEPTVGVDVQSRAVIIALLKELNSKGTTIVYTSHHMMEAQQICNRIVIIDFGKIIAEGKPGDLIRAHQQPDLEAVFLKLTGRNLDE